MNDNILVLKLLIVAVLTVSSCSQKEKTVSPEKSADGQNIVHFLYFVYAYKDYVS